MKTATDILQDYKRLYDCGALTDSEYSYLKKHLLEMGWMGGWMKRWRAVLLSFQRFQNVITIRLP